MSRPRPDAVASLRHPLRARYARETSIRRRLTSFGAKEAAGCLLSSQSKPVTRNGTVDGDTPAPALGRRFPHDRLGARVEERWSRSGPAARFEAAATAPGTTSVARTRPFGGSVGRPRSDPAYGNPTSTNRTVRPSVRLSAALFLPLLLHLCFFFSAFHVGFSIPIQRGASEPNYYDSSPPDSVGPFDLPPFSMIPRYLGRLCCPGGLGGGTLV
ncbi:Uncharacterized protein DBV15_05997, partial [Temnothorax longispinosus]